MLSSAKIVLSLVSRILFILVVFIIIVNIIKGIKMFTLITDR